MTQQDLFNKKSTSSQVDIHANPSHKVVKEKALKTRDTSFRTCLELLNKSDPLIVFLKTFMGTSPWDLTRFCFKWKASTTKRQRLYFRLHQSELGTKETEFGLSQFPTPTTKGFGHASEGQTMIFRKKVENGEMTEEEASAMMNGVTLRPPRMKPWNYPTPLARDHKDAAYNPTWKPSREKSLPREVLKNNVHGGKLNTNFVEFLMGYPQNWTKIDPTD